MKNLESYNKGLIAILQGIDLGAVQVIGDVLWNAYLERKTVFVIGNGGSAATASHWACDFSKGTKVVGKDRFKMLSLTDNIAWMTAIANDISYDDVFYEQLATFFQPGDVVVGISASGNSRNVLKAIEYCNQNGGISVGLTGFSGGGLKSMSQHSLHVDNNNYGIIEDVHMIVNHMMSQDLKERIQATV